MPKVTVIYGQKQETVEVSAQTRLGDAITLTGLPLEQPCAGRGTCGKCKVLVETGATPLDEIEQAHLTEGEKSLANRLACRARVLEDIRITLAPIVIYSNKVFRASNRYKRGSEPLGLAIDLGSTTVAAFLTMLDDGVVCAGGAALNQQTVFGADVIARLHAAIQNPANAERLQKLALASINQAFDSLQLSPRVRRRIGRVVIVGNVAMHHLLARLPVDTLAVLPFQPHQKEAIGDASGLTAGIFHEGVRVSLPPLIGGFVGSDTLACLAYFGFDDPPGPMAAIDLGTNGEVMVTNGRRILTASTAAGPAFEGVNISCGSRAVDGAITAVHFNGQGLIFTTIAHEPPVGLTGSGLLSAVHKLREAGVIEPSGRFASPPPVLADRLVEGPDKVERLALTPDGQLKLSQFDVRELQKAKGAIRTAIDILLERLDLKPQDLTRVILTGSFGGQIAVETVLGLGMIPPVRPGVVETVANGAGLGAAMFLSEQGCALAERLAAKAEQIDLDQDPDFNLRFVEALALAPDGMSLRF